MRVLIADDDAALRHGLSVQLGRWGYDPIVCSNGGEARIALGAADPPMLALLDRSMPEADGMTLCTEIRNDPALRPITPAQSAACVFA